MTKKARKNIAAGQRYYYGERSPSVKLLLEIVSVPNAYDVQIKVLNVLKCKDGSYRSGEKCCFSPDVGTWTYLPGQDKPKRSRKKN